MVGDFFIFDSRCLFLAWKPHIVVAYFFFTITDMYVIFRKINNLVFILFKYWTSQVIVVYKALLINQHCVYFRANISGHNLFLSLAKEFSTSNPLHILTFSLNLWLNFFQYRSSPPTPTVSNEKKSSMQEQQQQG